MQDSSELWFRNGAFAETIKVSEKFSDSNSFHDNFSLDFFLNFLQALWLVAKSLEQSRGKRYFIRVVDYIFILINNFFIGFDALDDSFKHFTDIIDVIAE